jgi:hypothetical protein
MPGKGRSKSSLKATAVPAVAASVVRAISNQLKSDAKITTTKSGSRKRRAAKSTGFNRGAYAAYSDKPRMVSGMSEVRNHRISWLVGYIYVGNGTLGATDQIYLIDPSKTYITVLNTGVGGNSAIFGPDGVWGAGYVFDVLKHYARMRIKSQRLVLTALQTSTANSMVVLVAPQRGATGIGSVTSTGTAAGLSYTNVISMQGVKDAAAWEHMEIDFTPFIGGGSGPKQNEFDTQVGINNADVQSENAYAARGCVPTTFAVSGNNSTSALRGAVTHSVFAEQIVDLLDYLGGNVTSNAEVAAADRPSLHKLLPRPKSLKSANTDEKKHQELKSCGATPNAAGLAVPRLCKQDAVEREYVAVAPPNSPEGPSGQRRASSVPPKVGWFSGSN